MAQLTMNGRTVDAADGQTVLEAAADAGITIPTLCHHKDLSPVGSCRLCLVEVESLAEQVAACTLPAADGMVVETETPALVESRRMILDMLLRRYVSAEHPTFGKLNELEHWAHFYNVTNRGDDSPNRPSSARGANGWDSPRFIEDSDPNPFIRVDLNQCILCTRCVRACEEVQGRFVWGVGYRGDETKIIAGLDTTMLEARCESCGACAAYCPTSALVDRQTFGLGDPDKQVTTTCSYCGVGCQFRINVKEQQIVGVTSYPDAPVNGMSLCVKGRYGWDYVHHSDRLTKPLVRKYVLDADAKKGTGPNSAEHLSSRGGDLDAFPFSSSRGDWVEVDWDTALNITANRLSVIRRESGPNAIGVLSSAKCTNEENYLMQKFARQVIQTHNVDHCARLCHSSTVAGLAMAFGSGAMSNSMRDIVEHARAIFIIGSNTTEQHPVFGAMIRQAVLRRGVKLVVADPRQIDVAEFAELHIRQRPGTDVALLNGIMHIALKNGWHDPQFMHERCEGFEEFRDAVSRYTAARVAEITGVSIEQLRRAAEILSTHRPMSTIWAMGITQHTKGVMNVLALANLQMLLGNMGVPGGGVNPLRGQNNVQGACDMGALPNVFPGYQSVTDRSVSTKFDDAWANFDESTGDTDSWNGGLSASAATGLTVTEMVEAAGDGDVRALYILGEDPVMTEPDSNHVRQCLAAAEFVVLQEIFPSETSHFADILLPGASSFEKNGTFTNTERRIQLVREAIPPLDNARPDWAITADLARRVLALERRRPTGEHAEWDYVSPAAIMDEIAALTPSYAGVSHARLENGEQLQWPVLGKNHPGTPILHVGEFARGNGKFHAVDHLPAQELPDDEYPFLLTTGRVLYHWHGGELTRRARSLMEAYPKSLVEISPEDASRLHIATESTLRLSSRRGEVIACAVVTNRVPSGIVFGNFHFPNEQNINNLTILALDPVAKIPEYKVCAVKIEAMS